MFNETSGYTNEIYCLQYKQIFIVMKKQMPKLIIYIYIFFKLKITANYCKESYIHEIINHGVKFELSKFCNT